MNIPLIDAATPEVAEQLHRLVDIVTRSGGHLDSTLRIRERDGHMSLECEGESRLVVVSYPRALLVPVSGAVWGQGDDVLALERAPEGLTGLQRELLDAHIRLYNAAGKIPETVHSHPQVGLSRGLIPAEPVRALRPRFAAIESAAEVFIGTRVFGIRGSEGSATMRVLMPVIDLLNHHSGGAPYELDDLRFGIAAARPLGTAECFAHYGGLRDAVDLALGHGYCDTSVSFYKCVPLTVDVPGLGAVRVAGMQRRNSRRHVTPRATPTEDGVEISLLTFFADHPERSVVPVRMALQAVAARNGADGLRARELADEGVALLARRNLELLEDLVVACGPAANLIESAQVLVDSASHSASVIRRVLDGL